MTPYLYSVIRFVPSLARGERVNLGLIVGSEADGRWRIEHVTSSPQASKLGGRSALAAVLGQLSRISVEVDALNDPDLLGPSMDFFPGWLSEMSRSHRNMLQFSSPRPIMATSADEAHDRLWSIFIATEPPARRTSVSKATVLSQYVHRLEAHGVGKSDYWRGPKLRVQRTSTDLDLAVKNGEIKQLTQAWSFQVKEPSSVVAEVKSWAWTIRSLRQRGGMVTTRREQMLVKANVPVVALYAPGEDNQAMDEAFAAFEDPEIRAQAIPLGQFDEQTSRVAADLH